MGAAPSRCGTEAVPDRRRHAIVLIRLESRKVQIAGIASQSNQVWLKQIARKRTVEEWGFLQGCQPLLHGRDTQYT